jgi:hypothetical protein
VAFLSLEFKRLCSKSRSSESAFSGRLKIAQRFLSLGSPESETKSGQRTAEDRYRTAVASGTTTQLTRNALEDNQLLRLSRYPLATARGSVSFSRPLHGLNMLETLFPSSELLGYYHSSALRTDNYFSGKVNSSFSLLLIKTEQAKA